MSAHRAVLLALLVVGGSLVVAVPTSAMAAASVASADAVASGESRLAAAQTDTMQTDTMQTDASAAQNDDTPNATQNDTNESLGADISSFMQSSAAEIGGAVETGMWTAAFNATTNRSTQQRLVERRTNQLRDDLTDLQNRKEALAAEREAGNITKSAYKAKVGQLVGRINALQAAINATESRARQVGTNLDAIQMLENDTRNLSGPEIAAVARNTTGIGNGLPGNVGNASNGNGPPNGVGNGANGLNGTNESNSSNSNSNGLGNGLGNGNGSNGVGGLGGTDDNASGERGPPENLPIDANNSENLTADRGVPNATTPSIASNFDKNDESSVGVSATSTFSFESSASDDV